MRALAEVEPLPKEQYRPVEMGESIGAVSLDVAVNDVAVAANDGPAAAAESFAEEQEESEVVEW